MMFCSSIEYLNGQYDPLDIRLEGWAESVMLDIESYDDIFIELHEKYSGVGDVAPEITRFFRLQRAVPCFVSYSVWFCGLKVRPVF